MKTVIKFFVLLVVMMLLVIFLYDWSKNDFAGLQEEALSARNKLGVEGRYMILVDYTKSILSTRLWVIDTQTNEIVLSSRVSHAWQSGVLFASDYLNQEGSNKSSYGSFITLSDYNGKYGKSMKVAGLEKHNNKVMSRAIVFHSKKWFWLYLPGWSNGCFMTNTLTNSKIIDLTKNGCFMFVKE